MILFIDDEKRGVAGFVEELQFRGFDVVFESSVDRALEFFERRSAEVELLILDVMMPPGKSFSSEDTELGLSTGVRFYERVREAEPDLPIIVFSNMVDVGITRVFEGDPHSKFFVKEDLLAFELGDVVTKMLGRGTVEDKT